MTKLKKFETRFLCAVAMLGCFVLVAFLGFSAFFEFSYPRGPFCYLVGVFSGLMAIVFLVATVCLVPHAIKKLRWPEGKPPNGIVLASLNT